MFAGRDVSVVPEHSHYAIQVAFGPVPGIRFRTSARGDWTSYAGAIIPSRQPHSMDATALPASAVLFIEPETREGHALAERWLGDGIAEIPAELHAAIAPPLFAAWQEQRTVAAIGDSARAAVRALTGGVAPAVTSDERILRAIAYIRSHLDAPLTLEEVAAEAFLSPSRFRHLFVEQTGMALRPYILWRRLLRVFELLTSGTSLSGAAHAAGFADASHLTRTARRMFGFPPSALQMAAPLDAGVAAPPDPLRAAEGQPLRTRA